MREEKLGILCSGRGSNLASIIEAIEREEIPAEIAVVIADKRDAYALERARAKGPLPSSIATMRSVQTSSAPCWMNCMPTV